MTARPHLRWIRVGGRLLVLGLLLLAMLPPPVPWSRAAADFIVLVDDSLSMPPNHIDDAWRQIRQLLADAPPDTRQHLLRFAANPVPEDLPPTTRTVLSERMPRTMALDRTATDIATALKQGLRLVSPGKPAIMLLLSDTRATLGDTASALRSVHRANVPLYLLAPQSPEGSEPLRLADLQAPSRVNMGERVPAVAALEGGTGEAAELVLEIDGQERERRRLELVPGRPAGASFEFVAATAGVSQVAVSISGGPAADRADPRHRLVRAVNVLGSAPLLHVSQRPGASPLVGSLELAGWEVASLTPSELPARLSMLRQAGVVIIEDLATGDLGEAAWQTLTDAVQDDARGLLVLGGPNSFGAGAYRHSTLEKILPVTAQAADPQAPAAVVFLLDRSGSMGGERAGPSRLSLAREAVAASTGMLLPDDYLGIVTFAAEAELRLPLAARRAGSDKLAAALDVAAEGGTRLAPALQLAAGQLRGTDVEQRLIVLVTDGFASDENLQRVARDLRNDQITVIALAVGEDPNRDTLRLLTDYNEGRILSVDDAATLPRLMAGAVASQRAPAVAEPTVPLATGEPPFTMAAVSAWPPLSAYMVSKARPEAQVYLQSERGDPLLAVGRAGAGRVAVLPAGMGSWAAAWWQWPRVGAFLGGLVNWLDPGYGANEGSISMIDNPGELRITADLLTDGRWDSDAQPTLLIDDPAGARITVSPELLAPGRYGASVPAQQAGLYRATLLAGGRTLRHAIYRNGNKELQAAPATPGDRRYWLEQGWVRPWPGGEELLDSWPRDASGLRTQLLVLALFSYLAVLVLERGLARPAALWLRDLFSR